jgi:hypothetical protein
MTVLRLILSNIFQYKVTNPFEFLQQFSPFSSCITNPFKFFPRIPSISAVSYLLSTSLPSQTPSMTVDALWMTLGWLAFDNLSAFTAWNRFKFAVDNLLERQSRFLGDEADAQLADDALDEVAAVLLFDERVAFGAEHGLEIEGEKW